jgi:hypothetical protein
MPRRAATAISVATLLLAALLSGCTGRPNRSVAVLVTDMPQALSWAEQFNAVSPVYKISVTWRDAPWRAPAEGGLTGDLVAGRGLTAQSAMGRFSDLTKLLEKIGTVEFYERFLDLGADEGRQLLLPLSFTLPIILVGNEDAERIASGSLIEIDELRLLSAESVTATTMGFSPRWNPDSMYLIARLFGVAFRETAQSVPTWNDSLLREAVRYLGAWSQELNGGIEREELFEEKYLQGPDYRFVADGTIRFAATTMNTWTNLPAVVAERVDFRWLSNGGTIMVDEDVVMIGRPKGSTSPKAAEEFLLWLFKAETQKKILETDRYRRFRGFGFAGGFSSIPSVNRDALVQIHPFLRGRIPPEQSLRFPERLPSNWPELRSEIVVPWLLEQSRRAEVEEPLSDRFLAWQREHPEQRATR